MIKDKFLKSLILIILLSSTCCGQVPKYLDYKDIFEQLKIWHEKYPETTEVFSYGKTDKNVEQILFHIKGNTENRKKVLVVACIHSNEPLASCMAMGYTGYLLYHSKEDNIKKVLDSRDIFIVPVACPDHYPKQRECDGVDPNRNFDRSPSIKPIENLKKLGQSIKPHAMISLHTFGRVYLMPYGNTKSKCADNNQYEDFLRVMSSTSEYRIERGCEMYGRPIYGTEMDWFYKNGAFSIVQECGTHQKIPTWNDIQYEFKKTFSAFLYFIKNAPEVKLK